MEFEWDSAKESANLAKHGIAFSTAAQVLAGDRVLEAPSDRGGESRWVAIGAHPTSRRVIAIVYTMRGERYRIISARRARTDEEEEYWRGIGRTPSEESDGGEVDPSEEGGPRARRG